MNIQGLGNNLLPNLPPRVGEVLNATIVDRNAGKYMLNIKGAEYIASFEGTTPNENTAKVEVLKVAPEMVVRLVQSSEQTINTISLQGKSTLTTGSIINAIILKEENGIFFMRIGTNEFTAKLPEFLASRNSFQAKVLPDNTLQPLKTDILLRSDVKSEVLSLLKGNIGATIKEAGAQTLHLASSEGLKDILRNSGLFFENKITHEESLVGDLKHEALRNNNTQLWNNITRMQLSMLFLSGGYYAFFEMEDLLDKARIFVKREENGQFGLYLNMEFTKIGQTQIGIVPIDGKFIATIKTEENLSEEVEDIDIENLKIRWAKLTPENKNEDNLKNAIISKLGRFDIIG